MIVFIGIFPENQGSLADLYVIKKFGHGGHDFVENKSQ